MSTFIASTSLSTQSMVIHLSDMSNELCHRIYFKPDILVEIASVYHVIFSLPALKFVGDNV